MASLGFIPASKPDAFSIIRPGHSRSKLNCKLSGEEARQFYEDLMKDNKVQGKSRRLNKAKGRERRVREEGKGSRVRAVQEHQQQAQTESVAQRGSAVENDGHQSREVNLSERSMELLGLKLLRCAHEGDISGLKELLSKGVDINFQVEYSVFHLSFKPRKDVDSIYIMFFVCLLVPRIHFFGQL